MAVSGKSGTPFQTTAARRSRLQRHRPRRMTSRCKRWWPWPRRGHPHGDGSERRDTAGHRSGPGGRILPLDRAPGVAKGQTWEGYRDGPVVLGYRGSLTRLAGEVKNGYGRTVSFGNGDDFPPPYVAVTLSELSSPEVAEQVLDAIRQAPGDLPTPGNFPRGVARDLVADPDIAGADATLAFTSALNGDDDESAPIDSVRVVFVMDRDSSRSTCRASRQQKMPWLPPSISHGNSRPV